MQHELCCIEKKGKAAIELNIFIVLRLPFFVIIIIFMSILYLREMA